MPGTGITLPPVAASVVGSHGKPSWWVAGIREHEAGRWGPADLQEMLGHAADVAIRDMEEAGLDLITDGEMRRLDGYVDSYYAVIRGIEAQPQARLDGPWGYDQQTRFRVSGRIEPPEGGLGIVEEFKYALTRTKVPLKATCAGPLTFGSRIHPGGEYRDVVAVAERFAEVINQELKGLVAAGARWIQVDEPARGNVTGQEMARLFNRATEGVEATLGFHVCFGNRNGRPRFRRSYAPYFPGLLEARADQFVLEFAGREMAELELWKRYGDGRLLGAGVVDVKSFYPETAEDVVERAERVLEVCPADKLTLVPDCGFGWNPHGISVAKLRALGEGARRLRAKVEGLT